MGRDALTATLWICALAPVGVAQSECVAFLEEAAYPVTDFIHHVAHADLNDDGHEDLVLSGPQRKVRVFLGNGDGSFVALPEFEIPALVSNDQIRGSELGDLNGDAVPDLVLSVENIPEGYLYVAFGVGDGSFGVGATYDTRPAPSDILILDLNADGAPDLVSANFLSDGFSVLLGVGDGSFQRARLFATRNGPFHVVEIDLNSDAIPDLIVLNHFSGKFSLHRGVGDGSFVDGGVLLHDFQVQLLVGDTNGDGLDDVVTTSMVGNERKITVYAGLGAGQFAPALMSATTPHSHRDNTALLDFDGDGRLDLVVSSDTSTHTFLGSGDGTFAPALVHDEELTWLRVLTAADWNGDGMPDLAIVRWVPGTLRILLQAAVGAESYCSTSPNSVGPGARIAATGSFHVEDDDLRLTATGLPPLEPCLFFCGDLEDQVPFEGGTLCVGSTHGLYRILPPRTSSAAGVVTAHLDLTLRPFDEEWSTVLPGSAWSFQCWYRDAAAALGSRINLSDAVRVQFCR